MSGDYRVVGRSVASHAEIRLTLAPAEVVVRPEPMPVLSLKEKRPVDVATSTSRSNAAMEAASDVESQA